MKNLIVAFLSIVVIVIFIKSTVAENRRNEAVSKRNAVVLEFNECFEAGDWSCAEKCVRALLAETPDDENLQTHLAGVLFEQERYEESRKFIEGQSRKNDDLNLIYEKSGLLLREMAELGIEKSMHFRVEFEGNLSKKDVIEALSVLEVAYDSLCRLFDFRPENKMALVLYQSAEYQGVGPRPDWVGAVFDGKLRVPVDMMQYREVYRPVLFHELTHTFVRSMTRSKVPLWMNEGIAQVVDASRNSEPRPSGAVPSISALTEPFVNESDRSMAERLYWYSQKMVEELLRMDGGGTAAFPKFRTCLQDLRTLDVDEALKKHYETDAKQLLLKVTEKN